MLAPQSPRVGQPDVLPRQDEPPPHDELRVLPRDQHLRQPVESRVLDERGMTKSLFDSIAFYIRTKFRRLLASLGYVSGTPADRDVRSSLFPPSRHFLTRSFTCAS